MFEAPIPPPDTFTQAVLGVLQMVSWTSFIVIYDPQHAEKCKYHIGMLPFAVWDITWMSHQSMHSAKWMSAPEQVTVSHLAKCPHQLITWSSAWTGHSSK